MTALDDHRAAWLAAEREKHQLAEMIADRVSVGEEPHPEHLASYRRVAITEQATARAYDDAMVRASKAKVIS